MSGQGRSPVISRDRAPVPAMRAPAHPVAGGDEGLLSMQDALGNQAVCDAIRLSSGVSSPGDPVEREADRAADAVARGGPAPEIQAAPGLGLAGDWLSDAAGAVGDAASDVGNAVGDALDIRGDEARLDAEEDIREFRARSFAPLQDFTPSSGIGQFDASFDPTAPASR